MSQLGSLILQPRNSPSQETSVPAKKRQRKSYSERAPSIVRESNASTSSRRTLSKPSGRPVVAGGYTSEVTSGFPTVSVPAARVDAPAIRQGPVWSTASNPAKPNPPEAGRRQSLTEFKSSDIESVVAKVTGDTPRRPEPFPVRNVSAAPAQPSASTSKADSRQTTPISGSKKARTKGSKASKRSSSSNMKKGKPKANAPPEPVPPKPALDAPEDGGWDESGLIFTSSQVDLPAPPDAADTEPTQQSSGNEIVPDKSPKAPVAPPVEPSKPVGSPVVDLTSHLPLQGSSNNRIFVAGSPSPSPPLDRLSHNSYFSPDDSPPARREKRGTESAGPRPLPRKSVVEPPLFLPDLTDDDSDSSLEYPLTRPETRRSKNHRAIYSLEPSQEGKQRSRHRSPQYQISSIRDHRSGHDQFAFLDFGLTYPDPKVLQLQLSPDESVAEDDRRAITRERSTSDDLPSGPEATRRPLGEIDPRAAERVSKYHSQGYGKRQRPTATFRKADRLEKARKLASGMGESASQSPAPRSKRQASTSWWADMEEPTILAAEDDVHNPSIKKTTRGRNGAWPVPDLFGSSSPPPSRGLYDPALLKPVTDAFELGRYSPIIPSDLSPPPQIRATRKHTKKPRFHERRYDVPFETTRGRPAPSGPRLLMTANDDGQDIDRYMKSVKRSTTAYHKRPNRPAPPYTAARKKTKRVNPLNRPVPGYLCKPIDTISFTDWKDAWRTRHQEEPQQQDDSLQKRFAVNEKLIQAGQRAMRNAAIRPLKSVRKSVPSTIRRAQQRRASPPDPHQIPDSIDHFTPSQNPPQAAMYGRVHRRVAKIPQLKFTARSSQPMPRNRRQNANNQSNNVLQFTSHPHPGTESTFDIPRRDESADLSIRSRTETQEREAQPVPASVEDGPSKVRSITIAPEHITPALVVGLDQHVAAQIPLNSQDPGYIEHLCDQLDPATMEQLEREMATGEIDIDITDFPSPDGGEYSGGSVNAYLADDQNAFKEVTGDLDQAARALSGLAMMDHLMERILHIPIVPEEHSAPVGRDSSRNRERRKRLAEKKKKDKDAKEAEAKAETELQAQRRAISMRTSSAPSRVGLSRTTTRIDLASAMATLPVGELQKRNEEGSRAVLNLPFRKPSQSQSTTAHPSSSQSHFSNLPPAQQDLLASSPPLDPADRGAGGLSPTQRNSSAFVPASELERDRSMIMPPAGQSSPFLPEPDATVLPSFRTPFKPAPTILRSAMKNSRAMSASALSEFPPTARQSKTGQGLSLGGRQIADSSDVFKPFKAPSNTPGLTTSGKRATISQVRFVSPPPTYGPKTVTQHVKDLFKDAETEAEVENLFEVEENSRARKRANSAQTGGSFNRY